MVLQALYVLGMALAAFYCFYRPLYNWDMLAYTHLILKMDHNDPKAAHERTYVLAQRHLPAEDYRKLSDSTHRFRNHMRQSAEAFEQQLPFYVVKPLYLVLVLASYKAGIPLPQATLVPSVLSYVGIGLLLFHWMGLFLRRGMTALCAFLIMISPPLLYIAKAASPDSLSCLLLLAVFYCIMEKPALRPLIFVMVLSILARLDNIVTCFLILCFLFFSRKWPLNLSFRQLTAWAGCFLFCYFLIGLLARSYGWSLFFYGDFMARLHPYYGTGGGFRFSSYVRVMYEHFMAGMNHSYLALFLTLLVYLLRPPFSMRNLSFEKSFALLIPFILLVRFILFPEIADRFYIPFYLLILVLLAKEFRKIPAAA